VKALTLPWGLKLSVKINESVGQAIWQLGVYDLVVSETLWRLTDPEDFAVDIGANIGYMTSILAARMSKKGRIVAFEPHPELFARLEENVRGWNCQNQIDLVNTALSETEGIRSLSMPDEFNGNEGIASLTRKILSGRSIDVLSSTLDNVFSHPPYPTLIKIDIEGAEAELVRGGRKLLHSHQVRDIIFEDHERQPSQTTNTLTECGYRVFKLTRSFFGPKLMSPLTESGSKWEPPSYLATMDAQRALDRMGAVGWKIL